MQGKLNEIDIRSILQLVELGQRTGELFVEAYPASETLLSLKRRTAIDQSWFVFFLNGRIIYAGDSRGNLGRLRDHLRRYKRESAIDSIGVSAIATFNAPEYGYLWALLENHTLTPAQGRSIIQSLVRETLFDLFTLHQGSFIFEVSPALSPQLTTLEINPLTTSIIKQVQEWKQFHPHIQTPDQCPVLTDPQQLRSTLRESTFKTLEQWVDGKTSIRQIARYLGRDILTVARAIYPYVQQGWVQLVYRPSIALPDFTFADKIPHVVCIEDSATVRQAVEEILHQHGYEATTIANPLEALSLVFQLKPDLILCDISMPELDGYEICAMLRKSTAFRQTPIVMLTGRDGFIDRVKARMVGATDYLTKPFGESELRMLVEKYVGVGQPQKLQSLSHHLAAELELEIDEAASTS
ncbi:response regulator [Microcoleus sp. FACHB-1515]|uniref:response regulator n=1 Tax=Cyanophyceae TaxID=3028117 RepID=UPI001689BDB3|nr:response regulator [Microcoleus sp. FACHB-1515]MBD2089396.1 response regulator [Microcoleus sp. FACHB-1515]